MSAMLLQCCGCAEKIMNFVGSMETATNCKDVEIADVICCSSVIIVAILVAGFLAWKLIENNEKENEREFQKTKEAEEAKRKQKSDLQDKLIDFLEKNTTKEEYNVDTCKLVKTLKDLDSEESQYYVKVILSLISNKTIPDYPQKSKGDKDVTSNE